MNAQTKVDAVGLDLLRKPFEAHHISKLPKETRAQIDARKGPNGAAVMIYNCPECGGHHHKKAVHLDYVGHAALTDRLLDTDVEWSWEPLAFGQDGLPAFDGNRGLWIKLTVCGVTRLGYGSADGKQGGDAIKEIIGDALRNAAMRFGAALDLWHKGDLHPDMPEEAAGGHSQEDAVSPPPANYAFPEGPAKNITELRKMKDDVWRDFEGCGDYVEFLTCKEAHKAVIKQVMGLVGTKHEYFWLGDGADDEGLCGLAERIKHELQAKEAA